MFDPPKLSQDLEEMLEIKEELWSGLSLTTLQFDSAEHISKVDKRKKKKEDKI